MDNSLNTRQSLLQRIRSKDDEESWEEFTHYYHKFLYLICRRMNLNHYDSEEVVQKVLIKLWEQLPKKESIEFRSFRSWLCSVVSNSAKDFIRVSFRRSNYENLAGEEEITKFTIPDIELIAEEEWESFMVTQAMDNVREMFSAKVIEIFDALHSGLSIQDAAKKYEIPSKTVSVYKHRVAKAVCREIRRLEQELR